MNHVARFKVVYIQALAAVAAAAVAGFTQMQDLTKDQLNAVTWVRWLVLWAAVALNAANTIVASFQPPPSPPAQTQTPPKSNP